VFAASDDSPLNGTLSQAADNLGLASESKGNGLGCADKANELNGALQAMEKACLRMVCWVGP